MEGRLSQQPRILLILFNDEILDVISDAIVEVIVEDDLVEIHII